MARFRSKSSRKSSKSRILWQPVVALTTAVAAAVGGVGVAVHHRLTDQVVGQQPAQVPGADTQPAAAKSAGSTDSDG